MRSNDTINPQERKSNPALHFFSFEKLFHLDEYLNREEMMND